ncbi:MAG TPA: hypothetical protein VGG68_00750 [Caulobacteraceae bacterium]|jgi:hypothetical protein
MATFEEIEDALAGGFPVPVIYVGKSPGSKAGVAVEADAGMILVAWTDGRRAWSDASHLDLAT